MDDKLEKKNLIKVSDIQVDYESEEKRLLRKFNKTGETGTQSAGASFPGNETPRIAAAKELSRRLGIEIDAAIYERVYPMTTLQRDFYLDSLSNPLSCGHRVSAYRLIHTAIEPGTWEEAVRIIIRKYPALRTDFLVGSGRFFQGVRKYENKECDFLYVDRTTGMNLCTHSKADCHGEVDTGENTGLPLKLRQEIYDEIKKITLIPHDVTRKPVKFFFIKFAPNLFAAAFSIHHAVVDGTAGMIIFNELEAYYQKKLKGTPVVIEPDHTYENYVAYHLENFDTGKVKQFWQKKLAAVEPVVKNRSGKLKSKYTDYRIPLNPEGSRQVVEYCKAAGVSPAIYFKGLYGLMLHYYTRPAANFHIRDVASGRTPRYQSTIGPMILVIPTIVDITRINGAGEVSIIEYLQDFRRQKKQLGDNQYISNALQIKIMGRQELFFDYNFLALNSFKITNDKGIPLEIVEEEANAVIFRIEQTTEGFTLCFHYNEKEFFGERFMERLKHISRQILTGTKTFSELIYHFDNEWELLQQWNDTAVSYPAKTVVGAFEEQALQSPDAIAMVGQDRKKKGMEHTLTYSRFNRQAHNLAHQLRQKGVG
ncbi:MAG: hypothetical protein GY757_52500, partial [bacterium]|nr:hypothetical protein [bacterium]